MNIYFGENLKRLRLQKNLTQEKLADFLGVSFQSISKWERGDTYPDITMLPSIASFFGVSADELLGVDKAKRDEMIANYIEEFERLYYKDTPKAFEIISQAVKEFPGEFKLLIRYMMGLISTKGGIHDNPKEIYDEMLSINDSIQNYSTSDSIRIKAKRIMGTYYKTLSYTEKDNSYIDRMEEINNDLPLMRDSKDYTATHMYPPGEKHNSACQTAIEELLFLLDGAICNYCYYNDEFSDEFKIKAAETVQAIMNSIYTDGNYAQNWHMIVYNYGHLGHWYFLTGDNDKAIENLKKCAELSAKYDSMADETILNSHLLKGVNFKKTPRGKTMCERMKFLMTERYPLSDDFKSTAEFKEIISMLS